MKKDAANQSQVVWEKRLAFVDLKCKFPTLHDKTDEELLIDKERPVKRPEIAYVFPDGFVIGHAAKHLVDAYPD